MLSRPKTSAFSLVEGVLSTFLLLTSVLLGAYVFHSSLRAEANNEKRVVAALVAESALAEIRDHAGRDFAGLVARYNGQTWVPEGEPDMTVSVRAAPTDLGLACMELESQYPSSNEFPEPERRLLSRSVTQVEVEVAWTDPSPQSVTLVEKVTDLHTATDFRVDLLTDDGAAAPESMSLARRASAGFRARAVVNGQPIDDIQFTWFVQPVIGFGSLSAVSRDGLRCVYQNAYRNYNDDLRFAPGACYLTLKATYQGRESTARIRIDNEA
jgi:Tfp pilus assembly protein PilV